MKKLFWMPLAVLAVFALAFVGCGGGGGDPDPDPDPEEVESFAIFEDGELMPGTTLDGATITGGKIKVEAIDEDDPEYWYSFAIDFDPELDIADWLRVAVVWEGIYEDNAQFYFGGTSVSLAITTDEDEIIPVKGVWMQIQNLDSPYTTVFDFYEFTKLDNDGNEVDGSAKPDTDEGEIALKDAVGKCVSMQLMINATQKGMKDAPWGWVPVEYDDLEDWLITSIIAYAEEEQEEVVEEPENLVLYEDGAWTSVVGTPTLDTTDGQKYEFTGVDVSECEKIYFQLEASFDPNGYFAGQLGGSAPGQDWVQEDYWGGMDLDNTTNVASAELGEVKTLKMIVFKGNNDPEIGDIVKIWVE